MNTFSSAPLKSPDAATALGVSICTLQRWSKKDDGIFKQGEHYITRSGHKNSPRLYDIPRCVTKMRSLGYYVPQETLDSIADAS